ncbi:sialate O-acetylesterase [Chitinophaga sp. GCM10012297]|uniref:Sialate O-acetylesterase n=1 Tax=Chitinophaga chungangae TaxID=2821488 RepID=A0ABS3YAL9_9BACT|nr:sialate O-acetylesterase [Chitinophaga chungangae]MBO9151194.1 sialate O-acetylesterase [Chitinophaga chungangae]
MMIQYSFKLAAACCMALLALVSGIKAQQRTDYDLYLLIGQSNMAGRGEISGAYQAAAPRHVVMFTKALQWVQAKHPLHFDKPKVAGVGPGLSFGEAMAQKKKRKTIALIPCAVGGSSIESWTPGGFDKPTGTHPYDDMLTRLQEAMKSGTLRGVIWLQGEADTSPEKTKAYLAKLQALITRIRTVAGNPQLPFVAGELGAFRENYRQFNTELDKLPQLVPFTAVATSEGLNHKGDNTHFDAASATEYGKRFAAKMKALQKHRS